MSNLDLSALGDARVAVYQQDHPRYPDQPPFHPAERYPEAPFSATADGEANLTYAGVRCLFALLGFDTPHYGTAGWNPLGHLINPGDHVMLKPNFIRHFADPGGAWESLTTHGAVIRAVLDYVVIALAGNGTITVADAPQNDADFSKIVAQTGLDSIIAYFASTGVTVHLLDIRAQQVEKREGIVASTRQLAGDPRGYRVVDLGRHSHFTAIPFAYGRFFGAGYAMEETNAHHNERVQEYLISGAVLDADVVINLPKMKTHKKTGVTLALKNAVGINGDKNWLPHHREGTPAQGGDQFASSGLSQRLEGYLMARFKRRLAHQYSGVSPLDVGLKRAGRTLFGDTNKGTVRSGNWYGNDTTWRMVLDLNRALLYADRGGVLRDTPQRRCFALVDGVVAGEGNGPLAPRNKPVGLLAASANALALDLACTRLMGFDYRAVPQLREGLEEHHYPLCAYTRDQVRVFSNVPQWNRPLADIKGLYPGFVPHFGWIGHLELRSSDAFGTQG